MSSLKTTSLFRGLSSEAGDHCGYQEENVRTFISILMTAFILANSYF